MLLSYTQIRFLYSSLKPEVVELFTSLSGYVVYFETFSFSIAYSMQTIRIYIIHQGNLVCSNFRTQDHHHRTQDHHHSPPHFVADCISHNKLVNLRSVTCKKTNAYKRCDQAEGYQIPRVWALWMLRSADSQGLMQNSYAKGVLKIEVW